MKNFILSAPKSSQISSRSLSSTFHPRFSPQASGDDLAKEPTIKKGVSIGPCRLSTSWNQHARHRTRQHNHLFLGAIIYLCLKIEVIHFCQNIVWVGKFEIYFKYKNVRSLVREV